LDAETLLLTASQQAMDAGEWSHAVTLLDELYAYQVAHPLPPLPTRHICQPPPRVADPATTTAELEAARAVYARLTPSDRLTRGSAHLRAVEAEERAWGRPGYAYRTGQAAKVLEGMAAKASEVVQRARLEPVAEGERLPQGWMDAAKLRDWLEVLPVLGLRPTGGGRWQGCPSCSRDKGRRGSVITKPGRWHCVSCSEGGSVLDAVGWALLGRSPVGREDLDAVGRWLSQH
jgi:hypothetical protein